MRISTCYGKSLDSSKLIFLLKEYHFRDFIVCDFLKQLESLSGKKRLMDCVEKRETGRIKKCIKSLKFVSKNFAGDGDVNIVSSRKPLI